MSVAAKPQAELDQPVVVPEEEFAGLKRTLPSAQHLLFYALAAGFTVYHLIVLNLYPHERCCSGRSMWRGRRCSASPFTGPSPRLGADRVPWYDWVLIASSLACCAYIYVELEGLLFRAGAISRPADIVRRARRHADRARVRAPHRRARAADHRWRASSSTCSSGRWLPGVLYHRGYESAALLHLHLQRPGHLRHHDRSLVDLHRPVRGLRRLPAGLEASATISTTWPWRCSAGPAAGRPRRPCVSGVLFGAISGILRRQRRRVGRDHDPDDAPRRLRPARPRRRSRRPPRPAGRSRRRCWAPAPSSWPRSPASPTARSRLRPSSRASCSTSPATCMWSCMRASTACGACRAPSCRRCGALRARPICSPRSS